MESNWVSWLSVFMVIGLLIYLTYGITLSTVDYPAKSDEASQNAIIILVSLSAFLFIVSGATVAFGKPGWASIILLLTIMMDATVAGIIGTKTKDSNSAHAGLAYTVISPIVMKVVLFGYLAYLGGSCDPDNVFGQRYVSRYSRSRSRY
jgi:predicted Na+-dependent transporter